jgi:hypothetical protein
VRVTHVYVIHDARKAGQLANSWPQQLAKAGQSDHESRTSPFRVLVNTHCRANVHHPRDAPHQAYSWLAFLSAFRQRGQTCGGRERTTEQNPGAKATSRGMLENE